QPAVLSLVPKAKQIMLIGALSVEGFDYYELLNANNTKAKGVGADEFCLFLGSLGARLPKEAIIIMDNAPIHQGDRLKEFITSLDASKLIKVEFLPPYSPFLNPIEYSFHSIKSYVRSKEPPNRMALVDEIKKGIQESITPEKSQHFFAHYDSWKTIRYHLAYSPNKISLDEAVGALESYEILTNTPLDHSDQLQVASNAVKGKGRP
ncbi:hypothetical protein PGTUg99_019701, partial [Puccinia graminis f. sp. tritici]